jgi:hypothetical protein
LKLKNVVLLNSAIGETDKTVHLQPGVNGHVCETGSVKVQQITLDSLSHWRPDFIKIDVEGYEGVVLAGAGSILTGYLPTLFIELHPCLVPHRNDVRRIVDFLDTIYDSIEFFQYESPSNGVSKLLMRFGVTPEVSQMHDRQQLLRSIDDYHRDQPFWAVCRSSKKVSKSSDDRSTV